MSLVDALHAAYESIDREALLSALEPARKYRDRLHVRCPSCRDDRKDAYVFDGSNVIICPHANKCGDKISLLEYFANRRNLKGDDFISAAKEFCIRAGISVENYHKDKPQAAAARQRREILEQILDVCKAAIKPVGAFDPPCPGQEYLNKRGFDDDAICTFELGYLEDPGALAVVAPAEELLKVGFYFRRDDGSLAIAKRWQRRVIIPIRDRAGRLVGLCGRSVDSESDPKYLYTAECKLADIGAVGLAGYTPAHGDVVVVEGLLDSLAVKRSGAWGVALGASGTALSAVRWDLLWQLGARSVILALDNDDAGRKGLLAAIRNYDAAANSPAVAVIDPVLFDKCKDPDEYIQRNGASAFLRLVERAAHVDRYWAREVARGFDLSREIDRTKFLRECEEVAANSTFARRIQSRNEYFWTTVADLLERTPEELADLRHIALRERQEEKRLEAYQRMPRLVEGQTSEEIKEAILNHVKTIETKLKPVYVSPMLPAHVQLFTDRDMRKRLCSGDFIGVANRSLPTLDEYLLGLRGAIVLAGATNTGKTILLCQLAAAVLQNNPDACVLFLTIEMTAFQIRSRLLSHLAQMSQNDILSCERGDQDISKLEQLRQAERLFEGLLSRLHVMHPAPEQTLDSDMILEEIAYLKNASQCSRCMVLIDYIDVWEPPPEADRWTDGKIEKWQMRQVLNVRDGNGVENPVIAVSEIRKSGRGQEASELTPDDVMGSARKIYGADFVVLWDKMSDRMLARWFDWEPLYQGSEKMRFAIRDTPAAPMEEKKFKDAETKLALEQLKELMANQRLGAGFMNIVKIRDGGRKGVINVTTHWDLNLVQEGIRMEVY